MYILHYITTYEKIMVFCNQNWTIIHTKLNHLDIFPNVAWPPRSPANPARCSRRARRGWRRRWHHRRAEGPNGAPRAWHVICREDSQDHIDGEKRKGWKHGPRYDSSNYIGLDCTCICIYYVYIFTYIYIYIIYIIYIYIIYIYNIYIYLIILVYSEYLVGFEV